MIADGKYCGINTYSRDHLRQCELNWILATFPRGGNAYENWMLEVLKHRGKAGAEDLRQRVRDEYAQRMRRAA